LLSKVLRRDSCEGTAVTPSAKQSVIAGRGCPLLRRVAFEEGKLRKKNIKVKKFKSRDCFLSYLKKYI
jgi:hypothetical protein